MFNAYRGLPSDRLPVPPELWYYYPAKLLGVDMIEFERAVPFHQALKKTFEHYGCEGWGVAFAGAPNEHTPSLPDAHPRSDRFRCGGRESNFSSQDRARP